MYVSGKFAKSIDYDENLLDGYKAAYALPDELVKNQLKRIVFFAIKKIFCLIHSNLDRLIIRYFHFDECN